MTLSMLLFLPIYIHIIDETISCTAQLLAQVCRILLRSMHERVKRVNAQKSLILKETGTFVLLSKES